MDFLRLPNMAKVMSWGKKNVEVNVESQGSQTSENAWLSGIWFKKNSSLNGSQWAFGHTLETGVSLVIFLVYNEGILVAGAEFQRSCKMSMILHAIVKANHGSSASLKFCGIEKIQVSPRVGAVVTKLLKRRSFWIHELYTVEPFGLNKELNLSCILWDHHMPLLAFLLIIWHGVSNVAFFFWKLKVDYSFTSLKIYKNIQKSIWLPLTVDVLSSVWWQLLVFISHMLCRFADISLCIWLSVGRSLWLSALVISANCVNW